MPRPAPATSKPAVPASAAGILLAVYAALVVYASLYPFVGWRSQGLWPWHFVAQPLPYYWTAFDATINLLGYVPLGLLLMWARLRRAQSRVPSALWCMGAVLWVGLLGGALSGALEALQTYLPQRKASNLDWVLNALGALLGAALGWLVHVWARRWARLRLLHAQWLELSRHTGARGVLVLLVLWLLALLYPSGIPFVLTLPQWFAQAAQLQAWPMVGAMV